MKMFDGAWIGGWLMPPGWKPRLYGRQDARRHPRSVWTARGSPPLSATHRARQFENTNHAGQKLKANNPCQKLHRRTLSSLPTTEKA